MRGATRAILHSFISYSISIHTPHAGSDGGTKSKRDCPTGFQSTLPMRGATGQGGGNTITITFQSTLPMRGATKNSRSVLQICNISIHTPHAGSDRYCHMYQLISIISIHTPHAGSDVRPCHQSRLLRHFNPHSPCGERPASFSLCQRLSYFNPHSPCGERQTIFSFVPSSFVFQSTLPMRGATTFRQPLSTLSV